MKLQTALLKAATDSLQHLTGLLLCPAMDDRIVRIALESDTREVPLHPDIERIVQKEISQQRTDYSPNAKGNFRFERVIDAWRARPIVDLRRK